MPTILPKLRRGLAKADEFIQEHELAERFEPVATVGGFLIVLSLVLLGIYAVIAIPHVVIQRSLDAALSADRAKQLELEDMYRKTITQIVLGVFGLFLLYFTWRRSVASDKTVRIAEQGHITDRFTKAIEQLGKTDGTAPNIEVRLGAIYALERIAIDSPRDHWTIMEILTAYVRQNASLDPGRPYTEGEKPRTDIQAILNVLGRRKTGASRERPEHHLDLSCTRLCGASLWGAKLQRASLREANLEDADLRDANLELALLWNANLQRACLMLTNLRFASALRVDQIKSAVFWETAYYSPIFQAKLGLPLKSDKANSAATDLFSTLHP